MGGLLGALTIYILLRKQMMYLSDKRKMKRSIAATLITAEAILCFLVPLGLVVWLAVVNLQNINLDPQAIIAPFEEAADIIKAKTGYYIPANRGTHIRHRFLSEPLPIGLYKIYGLVLLIISFRSGNHFIIK